MSPEAEQAYAVLVALCGGSQYVEILPSDDPNGVEVEAMSSDADGVQRITIGSDGRVSAQ